jgi:WD40 repeat protein
MRWLLLTVLLCLTGSEALADAPSGPSPVLPRALGATYNLAQTAQALPGGRFFVGRWDGTLQLWQLPQTGTSTGPVLRHTQTVPSGEGVQALAVLDGGLLVSGHDRGSLALWTVGDQGLQLRSLVDYESSLGTATSATTLRSGSESLLVVGHESGWVSVWRRGRWSLALVGRHDVRSPSPVPSPYPLRHIRSVVPWRDLHVITGSEDGDLVMLALRPTATAVTAVERTRTRYSATAQRGINGLALGGELLAVTSCAVGARDANLHLWRVQTDRFVPVDEARLKLDAGQAQVYAFSAQWAQKDASPLLWVSTQEGLLWQLGLRNGKLRLDGHLPVASNVAATLVYDKERELLVAVGHEATVLRAP